MLEEERRDASWRKRSRQYVIIVKRYPNNYNQYNVNYLFGGTRSNRVTIILCLFILGRFKQVLLICELTSFFL
jgi:hypothetical protein